MFSDQRMSYGLQFVILFFLCIGGVIIGSIITVGIVMLWTHEPLSELQKILLDPANVQLSRFLQVIGTFFFMAVPAVFFALIVGRKPLWTIGFNKILSGKQVFFIVLIVFLSLGVSGAFAELNQRIPLPAEAASYFKELEDNYNKQVMTIGSMKSFADYLLSLCVLALLPAMFEEMFFRGCLQQVMIGWTKNVFLGIFITSAFFSLIHGSYYGFLPRLYLGMMLGYIFYYSKNVWLSILAHFLNNAFAVTMMYSLSRSGRLTPDAMDERYPLSYGLIGLAFVWVLFILFKRESEILNSANTLQQNSDDNERMV